MDDRSIDEDPEAVGEDELVEDDEEMLPADDSPEATAEAGLTSEPLELEEPE